MTTALLNKTGLLQSRLKGEVLIPGDADFAEAAAVWNGAVTRQPQMVVMPENSQDIIETIQYARQHKIPLAVKGGGHDWAGRATGEEGIQINMRRMNGVGIDPVKKTAVVQGGALSIEVIQAAERHGLIPVTATHDTIGYRGLALGGGYSPLSPAFGLVVDNVIGAELVLDDGTLCRVDAENHPDLFWAIRGGGGNFGVVASLTIRLHDAKPMLSGIILFQVADAVKVLRGFNDIMTNAPDQLAADCGVMHGPGGQTVVYLIPFWYGASSEGEKYMEVLKQLATPIQAFIQVMSYGDMITFVSDNQRRSPSCCALQTCSLPELDEASIRFIVEAVDHSTSPFSMVNIHNIHGRATRIAASETPFPVRQPHFMAQIIACWNPGDEQVQQHKAWAADLYKALKPAAFPGGYANIVGPDETEQLALIFGANLKRLQKIKRKYNPAGVFSGVAAFE